MPCKGPLVAELTFIPFGIPPHKPGPLIGSRTAAASLNEEVLDKNLGPTVAGMLP